MAESRLRTGRPPRLRRADERELYLCRRMGASIKDCGRVFHLSIPTVNRVIAKFQWCDERVRTAVREFREKMYALRPDLARDEPRRTRRSCLIGSATPKWADRRAMDALYEEARRLTETTGIRHEVDHIYPICSDTICGLHVHTNLRIVTRAVNAAKSNRWEESYE